MERISEERCAKMNSLATKCFELNAEFDNLAYSLEYNYFNQIDSEIVTSARRFLDKGIFKTMVKMQKLQLQYLCGRDINKINKEYMDIR